MGDHPSSVAADRASWEPDDADRAVACRCGHDRAAHEHFRRGTECSLCDCPRFRRRIRWRRLLRARWGAGYAVEP